ncbi:MAG: hypothetical protein B7Z44_03525 [Caulobacter sp. 12-67-6]|nr:MAG: hypothetical protein B7Z44_03525 [Caulobacter sp. 12-67-6]
MPAIAVTDHGNTFAAFEFYKTAKAAGITKVVFDRADKKNAITQAMYAALADAASGGLSRRRRVFHRLAPDARGGGARDRVHVSPDRLDRPGDAAQAGRGASDLHADGLSFPPRRVGRDRRAAHPEIGRGDHRAGPDGVGRPLLRARRCGQSRHRGSRAAADLAAGRPALSPARLEAQALADTRADNGRQAGPGGGFRRRTGLAGRALEHFPISVM